MRESDQNSERAIELYKWNIKLSQSLYSGLQAWEICLRNQLHRFLSWKYNKNWPFDESALRQMKKNDSERIRSAIQSYEQQNQGAFPSTHKVVSELSIGFWVCLLSTSYEVPYRWRHNLARIFPNDRSLERSDISAKNDGLRTLRNRIAHHEPIFHLPLAQHHADLRTVLNAMCPAKLEFADELCSFRGIWLAPPNWYATT